MLRNGRMAALGTLHLSSDILGFDPLWAVPYERPKNLILNSLRDCQGGLKFNANISHCAVSLGVTHQNLNGTQVARLL
jgi:hypothetical protein